MMDPAIEQSVHITRYLEGWEAKLFFTTVQNMTTEMDYGPPKIAWPNKRMIFTNNLLQI